MCRSWNRSGPSQTRRSSVSVTTASSAGGTHRCTGVSLHARNKIERLTVSEIEAGETERARSASSAVASPRIVGDDGRVTWRIGVGTSGPDVPVTRAPLRPTPAREKLRGGRRLRRVNNNKKKKRCGTCAAHAHAERIYRFVIIIILYYIILYHIILFFSLPASEGLRRRDGFNKRARAIRL